MCLSVLFAPLFAASIRKKASKTPKSVFYVVGFKKSNVHFYRHLASFYQYYYYGFDVLYCNCNALEILHKVRAG